MALCLVAEAFEAALTLACASLLDSGMPTLAPQSMPAAMVRR